MFSTATGSLRRHREEQQHQRQAENRSLCTPPVTNGLNRVVVLLLSESHALTMLALSSVTLPMLSSRLSSSCPEPPVVRLVSTGPEPLVVRLVSTCPDPLVVGLASSSAIELCCRTALVLLLRTERAYTVRQSRQGRESYSAAAGVGIRSLCMNCNTLRTGEDVLRSVGYRFPANQKRLSGL